MNERYVEFHNETDEQREIDRLRDELERIRQAATLDVQNAQADIVAKNREIGRLKGLLTKQDDESPENQKVRAILVLWRDEVRGEQRGPRPSIAPDSKRASRARWALKTYGEDRTRCAVLGCKFDDWAMGRIHKSQGKSFNDLAKHILKDEESFERFEALYEQNTRPNLEAVPVPVPVKPARSGPIRKRLERIDAGDVPPIDKALQGVQDAGKTWRATASADMWRAQCPAHDGDGFSLVLTRAADGKLLVHCNVGCSFEEVLFALGMEPRDCWEHAERDVQAAGFRSPAERAERLPSHLVRTMEHLVERNRKQAA